MHFASSRNIFIVGILWFAAFAIVAGLIGIANSLPHESNFGAGIFGCVMLGAALSLVLSILFHTGYIIEQGVLTAYSGPMRWKIDISRIKKIEKSNSVYKSTISKPALDYKGFMIYCDSFEDIFVSPKMSEDFVGMLLEQNRNIEVT